MLYKKRILSCSLAMRRAKHFLQYAIAAAYVASAKLS